MMPRSLVFRRREGGFAYIAAVVLMVVVAGLVAALLRLTTAQQATANDALLVTRAGQAARAGVEWMVYQVSRNGTAVCVSGTLTDFQAATGFLVSVSCTATPFNEGEDTNTGGAMVKTIYRIDAVACNGAGPSCPDDGSVGAPDYAERRRVATICIAAGGAPCY